MGAVSNTAFLGLPLLDALRGHAAVTLGIVADQLGCFMALAIGGALIVATYAGEPLRAGSVARKILLFPPFLAVVVALSVGALGGLPEPVPPVLHRLAQTLARLAPGSRPRRPRANTQRWRAAGRHGAYVYSRNDRPPAEF